METKPSYYSSTLSQLALGSVAVYAVGALLAAAGVLIFKVDVNIAKSIMSPFEFLVITFGSSYLATRKSENGTKVDNGVKP